MSDYSEVDLAYEGDLSVGLSPEVKTFTDAKRFAYLLESKLAAARGEMAQWKLLACRTSVAYARTRDILKELSICPDCGTSMAREGNTMALAAGLCAKHWKNAHPDCAKECTERQRAKFGTAARLVGAGE